MRTFYFIKIWQFGNVILWNGYDLDRDIFENVSSLWTKAKESMGLTQEEAAFSFSVSVDMYSQSPGEVLEPRLWANV